MRGWGGWMKSQLGLYLFCGLGILWSLNNSRVDYPSPKSPFLHGRSGPKVKARAYILGEKFHLNSREKRAHKKLHLIHLFSPSGMHLSALLFLPSLFLRKRKKIFLLLLAFVFGAALFFDLPHSFRRMCLVLGAIKITQRFNFFVVALAFLLDLVLGLFWEGFWSKPLSWFMSFLFMGTLTLQLHGGKRSLYMAFLGGQAVVGLCFEQAVYPVGMALGWLVTALFPCFFPLLLVESFIPPFFPFSSWSILWIVDKLSWAAGPQISPLLALVMACFYFGPGSGTRRFQIFSALLLIYFSLLPSKLFNLPQRYQTATPFPAPPPPLFLDRKIYSWGLKFSYPNAMVCRSRLYGAGWSTRCRK